MTLKYPPKTVRNSSGRFIVHRLDSGVIMALRSISTEVNVTMLKSVFTQPFVLSPDCCGQAGKMTPLGAFTLLQSLAVQHAEEIGVGGNAMAAKGLFWLTVHTRIDFYSPASLMDELDGVTWPEPCNDRAYRSYRSYALERDGETVAIGRTLWAILGSEGRLMQFSSAGFPEDYVFSERQGITDAPCRFTDDFDESDLVGHYTVRSTDIDLGHHMNNVAYVRVLLDCFPAAVLDSGAVRSMEVHYSAQCREGEELSVYLKREGKLCRMAIKRPEGKTAILASVAFDEEQ